MAIKDSMSDYGPRRCYIDEWWFCGVSEQDIGDPAQPRKFVKVTQCPLKRIELKDGTEFVPEEIAE
jgi:hypothetical protein